MYHADTALGGGSTLPPARLEPTLAVRGATLRCVAHDGAASRKSDARPVTTVIRAVRGPARFEVPTQSTDARAACLLRDGAFGILLLAVLDGTRGDIRSRADSPQSIRLCEPGLSLLGAARGDVSEQKAQPVPRGTLRLYGSEGCLAELNNRLHSLRYMGTALSTESSR
jgi:hypothetical protein